jgi:hypothetical protein
MRVAHTEIEAALSALEAGMTEESPAALYHRACGFAALYLDHMREEELELEPQIRAALSREQIDSVARGSVARTAPEDARVMLTWMLPAMPLADATQLLAQLPLGQQTELRALVAHGA